MNHLERRCIKIEANLNGNCALWIKTAIAIAMEIAKHQTETCKCKSKHPLMTIWKAFHSQNTHKHNSRCAAIGGKK